MKLADRFRRHPADADPGETLFNGPERARAAALFASPPAVAGAPAAPAGAERKNPYPTGPLPVLDGDGSGRTTFRPQPTFTPKETAAQPVLPADVRVPSRPAAVRADVPELAMLGRVRLGLEKKYRAEAFIADRQMPCFDAAVRTAGWLGLHMPRRRIAVCQYWETETWLKKALAAVDAEADAAEAEIRARNAAWDVVEKQARARRRAAADAAPAALESAQ
jgi:hypothetical protein